MERLVDDGRVRENGGWEGERGGREGWRGGRKEGGRERREGGRERKEEEREREEEGGGGALTVRKRAHHSGRDRRESAMAGFLCPRLLLNLSSNFLTFKCIIAGKKRSTKGHYV